MKAFFNSCLDRNNNKLMYYFKVFTNMRDFSSCCQIITANPQSFESFETVFESFYPSKGHFKAMITFLG